jgi:hypothetical protein
MQTAVGGASKPSVRWVTHRQASMCIVPHQAEYQAKEALELVHGDLFGRISSATLSNSCYFLLLIDDCS